MKDISFLKKRVRDAVVSDIMEVARFHAERNALVPFGGCLSVPREVFCMVDFLGAVAFEDDGSKTENGASSRKAAEFLKRYFPDSYEPFAPLLVHMWRHGTVHSFQPITYFTSIDGARATVTWTSNNGPEPHNRDVHLRLANRVGESGGVNLSVNICVLADDLVLALDAFVTKLEEDDALCEACLLRLDSLLEPREVESLPKTGAELKRLLGQQIREAGSSARGTLRGTQLE
ncbi:MAG: hypothetical protein Q7W30_02940 [Coriobacteriia bacterium]|nr:hypothetical protein [Coriobacteriia bacterium]